MNKKKYLTTGEFAKMCGTTKETLFHYDREGILKPKFVSANGYRRYQAEQFFEFDLICVLKDAGSSLEDIRGYMSSYDVGHFLSILDEKSRRLREQRRKLDQRLKNLKHISRITRSALTDDYGVMTIEKQPRETLLAEEVGPVQGPEMSWDDTAVYLSRHIGHCEAAGLETIFPIGYIITPANFLSGVYTESHFFSTADRPLKKAPTEHGRSRVLIKPAGKYAVVLHQGDYDSLLRAFPDYLAEIERRGLKVHGHAYIYMMLSYLSSRAEENDVHKIMIQVE
jgi:DNA-binding transcriptional MerR regulator